MVIADSGLVPSRGDGFGSRRRPSPLTSRRAMHLACQKTSRPSDNPGWLSAEEPFFPIFDRFWPRLRPAQKTATALPAPRQRCPRPNPQSPKCVRPHQPGEAAPPPAPRPREDEGSGVPAHRARRNLHETRVFRCFLAASGELVAVGHPAVAQRPWTRGCNSCATRKKRWPSGKKRGLTEPTGCFGRWKTVFRRLGVADRIPPRSGL